MVKVEASLVIQSVKNSPAMQESSSNAGNAGWIPGLGRFPGEGNGNPLQYSCLGNLMDRGAWQTTVHGFAKSCKESEKTEQPTLSLFFSLRAEDQNDMGDGRREGASWLDEMPIYPEWSKKNSAT